MSIVFALDRRTMNEMKYYIPRPTSRRGTNFQFERRDVIFLVQISLVRYGTGIGQYCRYTIRRPIFQQSVRKMWGRENHARELVPVAH